MWLLRWMSCQYFEIDFHKVWIFWFLFNGEQPWYFCMSTVVPGWAFLPVALPWVHLVHISFPSYIIPGLELLENWYPGFGCLSKVGKWTLDGNPSVCWIHRASLIYIILLGSGDVWIDSPCWIIFTLISRNCLILCSALFLHCLFIWSSALDIYSNICTEGSCKDLPRGM